MFLFILKLCRWYPTENEIKKNGGQFDVNMGVYDGAEVCELVGIFLLFQISLHYKKENVGCIVTTV